MYILQTDSESTSEAQLELAQFLQTKKGCSDASLLKEAYYAYHHSLGQLGLHRGDYVIVSALVDPIIIEAILGHGAQPIYIDVRPSDAQMDTEVLEHFLSLLTIVNANDELIYRKDERVIRAMVISNTYGIDTTAKSCAFIASRYNMEVLEDFTDLLTDFANSASKAGTYGQIAIAKILTGLKKRNVSAALVISNPQKNKSPFQAFDQQQKKIILPKAKFSQASRGIYQYLFTLLQGSAKDMPSLTQVPDYLSQAERWRPDVPLYFLKDTIAIKPDQDKGETSVIPYFGGRLNELQKFTFLSREKVAYRFLENAIWLG